MKSGLKKVDITFGIPMFNSEKYIGELLQCFCKRSTLKYEILIIDDGSVDNSVEICNSFSNLNIRVISQENRGVSATRNRIIEEAKGAWLSYIDSDDLINLDEYEKAFGLLKKAKGDLLINGKEEKLSTLIEKEIINSPCMKFYKISLLKKNKILFDNNISLGEDLIFNLKYYKISRKICFYEGYMYDYRLVNNASLTSKYRENRFQELMTVNEMCKKLFNDKKIIKSFEFIRIKNCFSCLKSRVVNLNSSYKENAQYVRMMKEYKKVSVMILNGFRQTVLYYCWYLLPVFVLVYIEKLYYKR